MDYRRRSQGGERVGLGDEAEHLRRVELESYSQPA